MSDDQRYIEYNTAKLIADLEASGYSDNNEFIVYTKDTNTYELMAVQIYVYKKSDQDAIVDVEQSINAGEFETARKKIREYKKLNINLIEWSIFEARMARMEMLEE